MYLQRQPSGGMSQGGLSAEEAAVVRETKEEYARRGSWVRIFPTEDSWDLYGSVKSHYIVHVPVYASKHSFAHVHVFVVGPYKLNNLFLIHLFQKRGGGGSLVKFSLG